MLIANSKLLYEMIFNLVDNAIRYTESGGKVVVLVEQDSIAVKDTGIGIPEEPKQSAPSAFRPERPPAFEGQGGCFHAALVIA